MPRRRRDEDVDDGDGSDVEGDENRRLTNLGEKILRQRICDNTRVGYGRKVKHWKAWCRKHHAAVMLDDDDDNIDLTKITREMLIDFLTYQCVKRDKQGNPILFQQKQKHQSYQHVSGYNSAIKDYYHEKRFKMSEECVLYISDFLAGYQRTVADLKQKGELPTTEGKSPLSFQGYKMLAKKSLQETTDFPVSMFAHVFILFCWNLISRCNSVSSLMFNHITMANGYGYCFPAAQGR